MNQQVNRGFHYAICRYIFKSSTCFLPLLVKLTKSLQSPSMKAFPFPLSFLHTPFWILPTGSLHWAADIPLHTACWSVAAPAWWGASQVSHSFHELCPGLPSCVLCGICHCVLYPVSNCLVRIRMLIQSLLHVTSDIVIAFIWMAETSTLRTIPCCPSLPPGTQSASPRGVTRCLWVSFTQSHLCRQGRSHPVPFAFQMMEQSKRPALPC